MSETDALEHDINRLLAITSEQANEIELLRAALEQIAAMHTPPYISAPGIAREALSWMGG